MVMVGWKTGAHDLRAGWLKAHLLLRALKTVIPAHRVLAVELRPVVRISAETFILVDVHEWGA